MLKEFTMKIWRRKRKKKVEIDVDHTLYTWLQNQIPVERFRVGSLLVQQGISDSVHSSFTCDFGRITFSLEFVLHSGILNAINYHSPHEMVNPFLSWVSKFSTL